MKLAFWRKESKAIKHEIKPYIEIKRHPCPFYGFFGGMGVMMDQEGNQCALIQDSYSPCPMQMNNETPDYQKCSPGEYEEYMNNTGGKLQQLAEKVQVFPKEFHPPNSNGWEGMSLRQWMDYILKPEHKALNSKN
jgi:hypothetical protein